LKITSSPVIHRQTRQVATLTLKWALVIITVQPVGSLWAQSRPCRFPICNSPAPTQIEPQAGRWKTWVLSSGSEFGLPSPPKGLAVEIEIGDLIQRARRFDGRFQVLDRGGSHHVR